MAISIRPRFALLAVFAATPALAQTADPIAAIRADRWVEAQRAAAAYADPVATKLVTYYRLLTPGAATADEITDFMAQSPDWPNQALLERRRQEAIAADPDLAATLAQCDRNSLTLPLTMLHCAEALANAGRTAEAAEAARHAWVAGVAVDEAGFLRRWSAAVSADDHWERFERPCMAAMQRRQLGSSRASILLTVPRPKCGWRCSAMRRMPRRRWPRCPPRCGAIPAWCWITRGGCATPNAPRTPWRCGSAPVRQRRATRRRISSAGSGPSATCSRAGCCATATPPAPMRLPPGMGAITPDQMLDAEFLAGFIALRRLNDAAAATRHFTTLAELSKAAITQGRAHYWLGRAIAASGGDPKPEYQRAAAWPTTFYGQLAALALGDDPAALARRITALHDPAYTREQVLALTDREVVRAAAMLVAWNDPHRARAFLLRMDELAPDPADRALTARFALRVGLPDTAVFVARRMGRDGLALPEAGWPIAAEPPDAPVDASVALGLIRQESSFDIGAVSPSGARGLMQLMPFTAQAVAKQIGTATSLPTLTSDPAHNMRLGTTYLREMLDRFGNSLPLAVAAYNAGPHRVDQWLPENGDPRVGPIDMLDWIELIPFNETRNYVQRVLENVVIYRARRGESTPTLLAQWTQ